MSKFKYKWLVTGAMFLAITLFVISPSICMQATSNGLKVWLVNVVPALFPFFIFTRIIISLNQSSIRVLDRFTEKCFNTNNSGIIYFLSLLSGYPIGAKLISSSYDNGVIDKATSTKMLSFCSTSGPMFIIGTIGIGVFKNAKIGYTLLIGHIIGSFLNGLLYRGKKSTNDYINNSSTKFDLNEIMFDSINSILMVGGYIVFASVLIELLNICSVLPAISNFICKITSLEYDVVYAFLCGLIEITNGLILLGSSNVSLNIKIILASFIIAFSGICIMLQSVSFLNKIGIKKSTMLRQKLTQAIFSTISTIFLINIFI